MHLRQILEGMISQEQRAREAGAYNKAAGLGNKNPHHPVSQRVLHQAYEQGYATAQRDPKLKDAFKEDVVEEKVAVPMKDGKIATRSYSGSDAASSDAVHNPLHHKDADKYGGAPPSRIEFERKGETHVATDSIISPQKSLNPRKVNRIASEFDDKEQDPVHLIKMPDGRHALAGGNHRVVAAIMSGRKKIKAHVIDHAELKS